MQESGASGVHPHYLSCSVDGSSVNIMASEQNLQFLQLSLAEIVIR